MSQRLVLVRALVRVLVRALEWELVRALALALAQLLAPVLAAQGLQWWVSTCCPLSLATQRCWPRMPPRASLRCTPKSE